MARNDIFDASGRVRMRNGIDSNRRNDRASKVTSMIELFSVSQEKEFGTISSPKPVVRRFNTFLESQGSVQSNRQDRTTGTVVTTGKLPPHPLKRRTSPISLANRTPKPYDRTNQQSKWPVTSTSANHGNDFRVKAQELNCKGVSNKSTLTNKEVTSHADSGKNDVTRRSQVLPEVAVAFAKLKAKKDFVSAMSSNRIANGNETDKRNRPANDSTFSDVTEDDVSSSANLKMRSAKNYWEYKIGNENATEKSSTYKPSRNTKARPSSASSDTYATSSKAGMVPHDSPKPRLKSAEYSPGTAVKPFEAVSSDYSTSLVADRVRNFTIRPGQTHSQPKNNSDKTASSQTKPAAQPRPRFLTSALQVRPEKLTSSLHGGPKPAVSPSSVRRLVSPSAQSGSARPLPLPRVDHQKDSSGTKALEPKQRNDGNNNRVVNPVPKPVRTFTFAATDLTNPIKQRPRRTVARVSSDASSGYDTLVTSSASDLRSPSPTNRAPKEGYEQVSLPGHSEFRSQSMMNPRTNQSWQRQHNYEEVESTLEDTGHLSRRDYDRIDLSTAANPAISNEGYSHLTFKQDLLTTQINGLDYLDERSKLFLKWQNMWPGHGRSKDKPEPPKVSPKLQHMKLRKLNSDMTDAKSRSCEDLTRPEKSVESGLMQVTDKIRDVFSQFGKKYRHRKMENGDDKSPGSSGEEDSDSETDFSKHRQTLDRVRTCQKNYRKTLKYKSLERELSKSDESTIFEQVLICKITADKNGTKTSKVVYRFPAPPPGKSVGDEKTLSHFCFPDIDTIKPSSNMSSHSFSFMLTREDGTRKFGYCRRVLPPGSGPRYPVVYCLISAMGSFGLYELLLDELEQKHRTGLKKVSSFLQTIFVERFPAPGRSVVVHVEDPDGSYNFALRRPFDTRLEHVDLQCLLNEMGVDNTIKVFVSLLLERRVIISGKSLSILTACIHALRSLLYPFVWQHVFIPVLPPPMVELCCSPTPLLVGILDTSLDKLKTLPLEEVLIINLSTLAVVSSMGDELEILPKKLQAPLMNTLAQFASNERGSTVQPRYDFYMDYESAERNTVISELFMHLFVEMIGHYQNHFQTVMQPSNSAASSRFGKVQRSFNKESFYEDVTSRSLRRFLDMFIGTQMFDGFIHSRELSNPDYEGLFERRIAYHLRNADDSQLNFKVFKSKMRKLMLGIGKKR